MWHVLDFFFSVCSVAEASIRAAASACPVSEKGSGSVSGAMATAGSSIKGRRPLESDTSRLTNAATRRSAAPLSDGGQDSRL